MGQPAPARWPVRGPSPALVAEAASPPARARSKRLAWAGPLLVVGVLATAFVAAYARESALDTEYAILTRRLQGEVERTGQLRIQESMLCSRTRIIEFADREGLASPAATDYVPVPADCILPRTERATELALAFAESRGAQQPDRASLGATR